MSEVVAERGFRVDSAAYLKDLQKLVSRTEDDLRERAQELSEVHDDLTARYNQAKSTERTLETFESWREEYLTQVAVAWVLTSVFLRYLEDNALVDDLWLSGPGERIKTARDKRTHYFQQQPTHTDREYLQEAFRTVAQLPGCEALFGQERNPLWLLGPSGDLAKEMIAFWQEIDPETGGLRRVFGDPSAGSIAETRFLGDLYQDLSEAARKRFALLQTPDFVEEFILDRTLEPAIETFGLDGIRMLDPTCGSGHFLLGGFARLLDHRHRTHPGESERVRVQKALDGVYGVDLNPFAVAIARFRLLVAALDASGVKRMKDAPNYEIHVAAGDSLLHGRRFGRGDQGLLGVDKDWLPDAYATGDFEEATRILSQQYHAVVGNPPYIRNKDRAHNNQVRERYSACYREFSLAVPFKELFFDKAIDGAKPGFMGMITANSFMKREFGRKLIEEFFPEVDLTHVIDTSGAYIPGHGTPTVILLGRNRRPKLSVVRAVLGIRGEPSTPDDPSRGKVWHSIVSLIDKEGAENDFVTIADVKRDKFHQHPWALSGGGASELKDLIGKAATKTLDAVVGPIGFHCITKQDDVFIQPPELLARLGCEPEFTTPFGIGEDVRDWSVARGSSAIFPYRKDISTAGLDEMPNSHRFLWNYRTVLGARKVFGGQDFFEAGKPWWEYGQIPAHRFKTPLTIAFAFVATHNHFVLDRGGKVFKQSAPVIKLPEGASEDEHLALLGLLNSSVACFWLKQVCNGKHKGDGGTAHASPEYQRYEFDGTKLGRFPIVPENPILTTIARKLDYFGQEFSKPIFLEVPSRTHLQDAEIERLQILGKMIALQEELDWLNYKLFGLIDDSPLFETGAELPAVPLGSRSFEIRLARKIQAGESTSNWFDRHNSVPSVQIPTDLPNAYQQLLERRIKAIETNRQIRYFERPEFKRRWDVGVWSEKVVSELHTWLLDRIESTLSPTRDLTTTARLAEQLAKDEDFLQVAKLYTGRDDFDLTKLVTDLCMKEDVPYLSALRYKATGLRKRAQWEKTWDLQRQEDASQQVGKIPVPPKYGSTDFLKSHYWTLRGKLDVPKERFISYPLAERAADPSPVIGWAGWNHLEQAKALATYFLDRKEQDGWDTDRLTPLLAGLLELIPWLKQWHNDIDPTTDQRLGDFYQSFLDDEARALGLTMQDLRDWRPPAKTLGKKKAVSK